MSVIQKIRDKYAVVIIVVICVAIVAFLLQDAFFGRGSMGNQSTTVGKVNGETLEYAEYNRRIQEREAALRTQMPSGSIDPQTQQYVREEVWNSFLLEQINKDQYSKLGIEVTDAELADQLLGKNPHPMVVREFTNPQTGEFNRAALQNVAQGLSQDQTGEARAQVLRFEQVLAETLRDDKYKALIRQGIYFPKWLAAQQTADTKQVANISYVSVPYATIADSTIKVTDAEMNDYIQKHKARFQVEEGRRVEYVSFDALPSGVDSAAALAELTSLKQELDTTKEVAAFINNNSTTKYFDVFIANSESRHPYKDSISNLPVGTVYGPYIDANAVGYAKIVDRKIMPDSVKFRHILIATQQGVGDSTAKQKADSLAAAIRGGADFAALVAQFSDDNDSKARNGEYELTPSSQFVNEIKDFAFAEGNKGQLKVVKLPVGYSVIQVMEQKNFGPAMKVAYLTRSIDPSSETASKAFNTAGEFASKYQTQAEFDKAIQEKGLTKRIAENIRPMDFIVSGLGQSRELVSWAYKADKGAVSGVISLEDRYVVAVLTGIREAGTISLAEVKPQVEAEVRRLKKADQIAAKLGAPKTLQAAAQATNQPVMTAAGVGFTNGFIASLGFEPRVAGIAFNKALGANVSAPVYGNAGVYVVKIDGYTASPEAPLDYTVLRNSYEQSFRSVVDQQLFDVLKKKAEVKDNRAKFF
jgi:peptidyl-prolyl cis-trans isomerase D